MYIEQYIKEIAPYLYNKKKLNKKIDVILYGAGEKAKLFLNEYSSFINIICIYDDDPKKWGSKLNGVSIVPFFNNLDNNKYCYPIFITSKWSDNISLKLNFQNIYHRFAIEYLNNFNELQSVLNMLADDFSKKVMLGLIKYVFTQKPEIFDSITTSEEQYFLREIFSFSDKEYIVDGGAFNGDTLLNFLDCNHMKFKEYYCFEPDEYNFTSLKNVVSGLPVKDRIKCYNFGLYSEETKISFSNLHSSASGINPFSNEVITVNSIDKVLSEKPITFIKLDVEGAEYEAIIGARKIISQYKPNLAICIYHLASDLWKLPLLIKEIVPEYQLYMRHHNKTCWYETVLYAKLP